MLARPLPASVVPISLGHDELSKQANIQHVENAHWGQLRLVTPGNRDTLGATDAVSAQQQIRWSAEVASKIVMLSVAPSSCRPTDPAKASATAMDELH